MFPIASLPQQQSVPPFLQGIVGTPVGAVPFGGGGFNQAALLGASAFPQQTFANQLGGSMQGGFPPGFLIGGPTNQFGMPVGGAPLSFGPGPIGAGSPFAAQSFGASPFGFDTSQLAGLGGSPFGASPFGFDTSQLAGLGGSPFGASPFGFDASQLAGLGGSPFGASPFGASPFGAAPFGAASLAGLGGSPFGASAMPQLSLAGGSPLALAGLGGQPQLNPLAATGGAGIAPTTFAAPQSLPPSLPPSTDGLGQMGQLIQMMLQMMMLMLTLLLGNRAPQPQFDIDNPLPRAGGAGNNGPVDTNLANLSGNNNVQVANVAAPRIDNAASLSNGGSAQLDASLQKIASTPDGAKLIAEAQRRGVKIRVGDPSRAAGARDAGPAGGGHSCPGCSSVQADGTTVVNGVTITRGGQTEIIVRDPNNIKTIVHELVHATTTEDGNSKLEETAADSVGFRVLAQIEGRGLSNSEITAIRNKARYYPNLGSSNNIENTLAKLGIRAFA